MNKCYKFCDKDYIPLLKKYTKKYEPSYGKQLNNPLWINVFKSVCKDDYCNPKCKYTNSRKKVLNKMKKKIPIRSYCKKNKALEKLFI